MDIVYKYKKIIKSILRKLLRIRQHETIFDGINRHYHHVKRIADWRQMSLSEFSLCLDKLNIEQGDVLIVHSSWRGMYVLDALPNQVIETLLVKLGKDGTLIMPCYGGDGKYFNMNETKSSAGVLSECLRNYDKVVRSCFPKYSMCAYGKYADVIVSEHINSVYQFDMSSPYFIAIKKYKAKVLLLGLGLHPHKISVFHCASYAIHNVVEFYSKVYTKNVIATLVTSSGDTRKLHYIDRCSNFQNDKKVFKKLFASTEKNTCVHKGLVMICFDALKAYNKALVFCKNGGRIYKIHKEGKDE